MSGCSRVSRPIVRCILQEHLSQYVPAIGRSFSTASYRRANVQQENVEHDTDPLELNPNTAAAPWAEKKLAQAGTPPIGSRRRRLAIRTSQNLPFEQLPFQCFQEARKILNQDREEKLLAIASELANIKKLEALDASKLKGGEQSKQTKIAVAKKTLEKLKILADINDPAVKRRFEDGLGRSHFLKILLIRSNYSSVSPQSVLYTNASHVR
jgi:large subunit ribosomal protein L35